MHGVRPLKYFGPFRFDPIHPTLWRGAERVHLTGKAASMLHCLIDDAGEWVSKSTILQRVWPDTHVHPDNIKVLIRELRVALGDEATRPRYIASAPRQGYTFLAAISDTGPDTEIIRTPPSVPFFVNRARELSVLVDEFGAALGGTPRVVLVTGAPGIGKSALCATFLRTATALYALRHVAIACRPRGASRPGAVVHHAVRLLQRDRVPAGLFAETTDSGPSPQSLRRLEWALAQAVADVPLVLVLEDVDRADDVTTRFLATLPLRLRGRLLILATARTPLRSWLPAHDMGPAPLREIELRPLTQRQVRRYLDVRFGTGRLAALAAPLTRASEGNLEFMVALMDGLVNRGLIAEAAAADLWVTSCEAPNTAAVLAALPAVLHEVLTTRHLVPRARPAIA
jgi:DNA-binding winged helix-turn-helix (wHTH) protein